MNKIDMRQEAYRRMSRIEEAFGDSHVPVEVMALYRLMKIIYLASIDGYFREFGFLPINPGDVSDAKQDYFGWGPITAFERQTCELLNEKCRERERAAVPRAAYTERYVGVVQ